MRTVWQKVRSISNENFGVLGLSRYLNEERHSSFGVNKLHSKSKSLRVIVGFVNVHLVEIPFWISRAGEGLFYKIVQ